DRINPATIATYITVSRAKYARPFQVGLSYALLGMTRMTGRSEPGLSSEFRSASVVASDEVCVSRTVISGQPTDRSVGSKGTVGQRRVVTCHVCPDQG